MDVHKEAVVIAVLNSSGKLVMESIVETKASSILQFIHGLQGELERSAEKKARARQRLLDSRRRLAEAYARLPNRPIWQAIKDSSLPAGEPRWRCAREGGLE